MQKQIDDRAAASGRPVEDEMKELVGEKQPKRDFTTPEQVSVCAQSMHFTVILLSHYATSSPRISRLCVCKGWKGERRRRKRGRGVSMLDYALLRLFIGMRFTRARLYEYTRAASQIGAAIVFLCSDAAANITGSEISMDGGWTAI